MTDYTVTSDDEVLGSALVRDRGGDPDEYVDDFVASSSPLSGFITQWGEPQRTIGEVCFWDRVQTRPGKVRGDLAVMPTTTGSLSWFSGESA